MTEEAAVLEPQPGANESSETGYVDRSIDTSIPVEVAEAAPEVKEEEPSIEAESPPADDGNVDEKMPGSAEERISELTRKWRTTERENESNVAEIADLRRKLSANEEPPAELRSPEEFTSRAEYNTYLSGEITARAAVAAESAVSQAGEKSKGEEVHEGFVEREKVYAKDNPDYFDLVYDRGLKISTAMKDVIQADENGLDLAVYLGSNPDIAKDIFQMSDVNAGMKLNLLLADIGQTKAKAKTPPVNKAPPPVPQIATAETALEKDVADMTDKEFAAMRRKQIAQR